MHKDTKGPSHNGKHLTNGRWLLTDCPKPTKYRRGDKSRCLHVVSQEACDRLLDMTFTCAQRENAPSITLSLSDVRQLDTEGALTIGACVIRASELQQLAYYAPKGARYVALTSRLDAHDPMPITILDAKYRPMLQGCIIGIRP